MKTAALCAGYGGLELGLHLAGFDVELSWYAEIDKGACTIMEANYPGVPNLGDLTLIEDAPPVDLVTAGFPCQPVSTAGARKGIEDERWLIHNVCKIASRVGARWLLLENVGGLYSANGGRAFSQVVVALASYGFAAEWTCLRAADIGAPHNRLRWFCLAYATSGERRYSQPEMLGQTVGRTAKFGECNWPLIANANGSSGEHGERKVWLPDSARGDEVAPDTNSSGYGQGQDGGGVGRLDRQNAEQARQRQWSRTVFGDRGNEVVANPDFVRCEGPLPDGNVQSGQPFSTDKVVANANVSGRQQQRGTLSVGPGHNAAEHTGDHVGGQRESFAANPAHVGQQQDNESGARPGGQRTPNGLADSDSVVADTPSGRRHESEQPGRVVSETVAGRNAPVVFDGRGSSDLAARFGQYADAIARWEPVVGRAAPDPTDDKRRLNPEFVEWMMGLPKGWVTGPLVKRGAALKALGNGVVPQQAAAAILMLVEQMKWEDNKEEVEL